MAYSAKLNRRTAVGEGTMVLVVQKPENFRFRAGQYADLSLSALPGPEGSRTFSLASAPGDPELVFATRAGSSSFKRALAALPPGAELSLTEPMGSFILRPDDGGVSVLIAGGMGITPFRSMIRDAEQSGSGRKLLLFYADENPRRAVFLRELQELAQELAGEGLRIVPVLADPEGTGAEPGRLSGETLRRYIPDLGAPSFYLAGSPEMVLDLREELSRLGADDDRVFSEEISGY